MNKLLRLFDSPRASYRLTAVAVVLLVGAVGAHQLFFTHAEAIYYASAQASDGTLAGGASVIADSAASEGKSVQFTSSGSSSSSGGATGGTPNLTAKNCEPNPSSCGYPDASNTGIQPGVTLTQVPSQATSGTGWSYSKGVVTITGNVGSPTTGLALASGDEIVVPDGVNNITIDNVQLAGVSGASDNGITIGTNSCQTDGCGPNNITVENCVVAAKNDTSDSVSEGILASWQSKSITVKNCNVSGASGGIYYLEEDGTDVTTGNYVHDPGAINGTIHVNGITSGSGPPNTTSSWLIQDNTVLMTGTIGGQVTSPISLFPDGGPQLNDHVTINENLLDTGNYYLIDNGYGDTYGSSGQSYIGITNNRLGASGNNAGTNNYTWYIAPNTPGCDTKNGGVACTGDTDSGNFWDATGKLAN